VGALIEQNPEYKKVRIIRVDWDKFGRAPITRELRIPRRSILVAFKGGKEQARVVGSTAQSALEELFTAVL
jgi:thioredoxin 1